MIGGRNSFAAGRWRETVIEKMLPVRLGRDDDWNDSVRLVVEPRVDHPIHPMLRLVADDASNQKIVAAFPPFRGANVNLLPKANLASVLAIGRPQIGSDSKPSRPSLFTWQGLRDRLRSQSSSQSSTSAAEPQGEFAAITLGRYGKGRTMAIAMPITGPPAQSFLQWGTPREESRYYAQFWRNATYWLTEQSYIGRRRLVASTDKQYYGPGDVIHLLGSTFDEQANETTDYRLVGMLEPQSFDDIESDYSIVRWPSGVPRTDADKNENPFVIWGEEFTLPLKTQDGQQFYQVDLPIADTLPAGRANQLLRLELTAYEDETQVDSTSVPIQVLHDPFEQQNPFPNHDLLARLAAQAGGRVLTSPAALAAALKDLPVTRGPTEVSRTPIWSTWWVMGLLLGLISTEWCYRRWLGLA